MSQIKLGVIAKDKVTGFFGMITGKAEYLTGCNQYLVTPKAKDSLNDSSEAYPAGTWIDEGRLEFVKEGLSKEDVKAKENGFDIQAPIK